MGYAVPCLVLALVMASSAHARDVSRLGRTTESLLVEQNYAGFLEAHPDLFAYRRGMDSVRGEDYAAAMRYFRRAARYADKPSQALIAEMYWQGLGVEQDRPLAYAWMDLAAERGSTRLLLERERYWEALSEAERAEALRIGRQVYDRFGDAVAKPRLEASLRRKARRVAGSRTGYTGNTTILAIMPGHNNRGGDGEGAVGPVPPLLQMSASEFFHPTYWAPANYYTWRDQLFEHEPGLGAAHVGPLEPVRNADSD